MHVPEVTVSKEADLAPPPPILNAGVGIERNFEWVDFFMGLIFFKGELIFFRGVLSLSCGLRVFEGYEVVAY